MMAAFINAIAEEGTKAEAVEWLQKTWDEKCELQAEIARLEAALHKIEDGRGGDPRQIAKDALMHDALRALQLVPSEIERLRERVAILEAELRVAYKLPAAIDAALSRKAKDGSR